MNQPLPLAPDAPRLFLDPALAVECRNVTRTIHQFTKHHEPLIVPDKPWEQAVIIYGAVWPQPGGFAMWYCTALNPEGVSHAYATSEDGIRWHKPDLGLVEWGGSRANNLLFEPGRVRIIDSAQVVKHDPPPAPDRAYVMVHTVAEWDTNEKWYESLASPDGIHWNPLKRFRFSPASPDRACLTFDPLTGEYVLYHRCQFATPEVAAREGDYYYGRAVQRATSADLVNWSEPTLVMHADADDPLGTDIYSLMAWRYGDAWLGLPQAFRGHPQDGVVEVQAGYSADGIEWRRERTPVIPLGGPGDWDRFNTSVASRPIEVRDEWWVYYAGRTQRHKPYAGDDAGAHSSAIGLARIGRERLASYDASFSGGTVVTPPLLLDTDELFLNAAARWGEIVVEALDEAGSLVATSHPVREDAIRVPVRWASGSLTRLRGATIRLRLALRNARVYALAAGAAQTPNSPAGL